MRKIFVVLFGIKRRPKHAAARELIVRSFARSFARNDLLFLSLHDKRRLAGGGNFGAKS